MVGSPFATEKKQPMQPTGTFLGLTHDFSPVASHNVVTFWARDRLHDKVRDIIKHARDTQTFTRGTASKLYGIANFLEQGIYGRVGYGGLMAIKARQDETITTLTPDICACFEVIEAVMRFCPKREFLVLPFYGERFLAASDAAIEEDTGGAHRAPQSWAAAAETRRNGETRSRARQSICTAREAPRAAEGTAAWAGAVEDLRS
eukprot:s317_g31.t1